VREFGCSEQWDAGEMTENNGDSSSNRRAIRDQIDENLKRVYAANLSEELPDRFRDLIEQLKARGKSGSGGSQ
jgi:hypothetical protein